MSDVSSTARDDSGGSGGLAERVDEFPGTYPSFFTLLHRTFLQFQSPPPSSTIPPEALLPAIRAFTQKISSQLNPSAAKLVLRPITVEDLESVAQKDPALEVHKPVDEEKFHRVTRLVLIHIALDRAKRLGLFVLSGIMAVKLVKGVLKRLPVVGASLDIALSVLIPSAIVGPMVGIAGALYM